MLAKLKKSKFGEGVTLVLKTASALKTKFIYVTIDVQWAPLNGITDNRINRIMGSI